MLSFAENALKRKKRQQAMCPHEIKGSLRHIVAMVTHGGDITTGCSQQCCIEQGKGWHGMREVVLTTHIPIAD